jgi:hypothetical protein
MRTNLQRALNGVDLAHSAIGGDATSLAPEDYEAGLCDALVNLMHMARRYDIDFERQLAIAREHHECESAFPWHEVPGEGVPYRLVPGDPDVVETADGYRVAIRETGWYSADGGPYVPNHVGIAAASWWENTTGRTLHR